jgi:hypothetical protein
VREYLFVEQGVMSRGSARGGLQSPWRKLKVLRETPDDFYVLKSDTSSEFAQTDEQLRLNRRRLEETGEFRDASSGTLFCLWPRRFS